MTITITKYYALYIHIYIYLSRSIQVSITALGWERPARKIVIKFLKTKATRNKTHQEPLTGRRGEGVASCRVYYTIVYSSIVKVISFG